jgi:hypothetical protein
MLNTQMPSLEGIFGQGFVSGDLGMQQFQMAQSNNQINQQGTLEEMMRKQQMHPLDMDAKRASTGLQVAQTGEVGERTRGARFTNDMNDRTREDQYKAHVSKYATEISDNDLKQMENSIQQLGYSNDPRSRQIAEELTKFKRSVIEERLKLNLQGENAQALANVQGGYQTRVAEIGAESRIEAASKAAEAKNTPTSFWANLQKMKKASEKYNSLNAEAARKQSLNPNDPEIPVLRAMAAEIQPQAAAELAAANDQKPGSVDLGRLPNARIPVVPPRSIEPPKGPQAAPSANGATAENPGIPKVGDVRKGYRYKGGHPGNPASWEKV